MKKIVFLLIGVMFFQVVAKGQSDTIVSSFETLEIEPRYPGGENAMLSFLGENINYPDSANENGTTGIVYAEFVVDVDGSISNAKILRGIGSGCDEEVIRCIKLMPRWTPAMLNGKKVRSLFTLPVSFEEAEPDSSRKEKRALRRLWRNRKQ